MIQRTTGGLEAVEQGPLPSDEPRIVTRGEASGPGDDPALAPLVARFGSAIRKHRVNAGDQMVVWIDPSRTVEILGWLRDDPTQRYDMMSDVTGVDYGKGAVDVVYQMFSTTHKRALRVRCELPYDALRVGSVVHLWQSANWLEREVYDLFGVTFEGHPDLRRILMPSDYAEGHPLRKDFPLRGRFTRAEQTRRALAQDVERFYRPGDLQRGGTPQEVDVAGHGPARDEVGHDPGREGKVG